jgi:phosphatidate phosphatase PAH1
MLTSLRFFWAQQKTDVAGYGAAKLGYEYIHQGVCEVVTAVARQGYRILFLTSRAITLAQVRDKCIHGN